MENTQNFDIEKAIADFEQQQEQHKAFMEETDRFIKEQQQKIKELEDSVFSTTVKDASANLIKALKISNSSVPINATVWSDEEPDVKYELVFRKL